MLVMLLIIKTVSMSNTFNDDKIAVQAKLDPVVAGPKSIMPREVA